MILPGSFCAAHFALRLLVGMNSFSYTDAAHAAAVEDDEGAEVLEAPVLSFVEEADELKSIIQQLPASRTKEDLYARFEKIVSCCGGFIVAVYINSLQLDRYQEQPQLLDPHLDLWITSLMSYVLEHNNDVVFTNNILRLVYFISKVRGFRAIGMWLCVTMWPR